MNSLKDIQYKMMKNFLIKKEFFVQSSGGNIKDHYQILQIIGRGAFATVYKSKLKYYPYTLRAIKRIKKKFVKTPNDILNQFGVLTSLDHPQIIKIYQTFQDNENFFIVMDYCEGGELFYRLEKQGNFSQKNTKILFKQMVNIIKYCHDNKICHRDLKPQNFIMISDKQFQVMLIDFGLCYRWKESMRKEHRAKPGSIIGTAYYMAPQIFTGVYDERCDIWSLGIILFMLVTGQAPINGSSAQQVYNNIQKMKLNFKVLKDKRINAQLVDLLQKILVRQQQRLSIKDIEQHPWMITKSSDTKLNISFDKIRNYSKFSTFKVLVLNYIASQLPQKQISLLGKIFMEIDKNKDGYLTVEQLSCFMKQRDTQIISYLDVDHNGKLAYNQFISACLSKSTANNRQYLRYAFNYFDLNHDGKISRNELQIVLKAYKKQYNQNQQLIDKLLRECDSNQDKQIDFQEYCKYIMDKNQEAH